MEASALVNVMRYQKFSDEVPGAHFQVAILVDENVGWFQIAVDDASRVDVSQSALLRWSQGGHALIGATAGSWPGIYPNQLTKTW
jgi:hypothetical protein